MINNKIFSLYVEMKIDHKYHLRYHFRYITTYQQFFFLPWNKDIKKAFKIIGKFEMWQPFTVIVSNYVV